MEITDRDWYFYVWLSLLISLASSATALTALLSPAPATVRVLDAEASETRPEQVLVETAEAAAQLSSDEHTYFQTLVAMHLRDPQVQQHALEMALGEEASTLAEEMNNLLEQPAAVRFHAVATWTAREIYCLIVYGEAEMFTSSYRGVFARLITRSIRKPSLGTRCSARCVTRGSVFLSDLQLC